MTKQMLLLTIAIAMLAVCILGLVLVFSAPARGLAAGKAEIRKSGFASMEDYNSWVEASTRSFQIGGAALAVAGLLSASVFGATLIKNVS